MTQKPTHGDQTWKEPDNFMRERIARIKELFPEIFTEGDKIDLDKVKEVFGASVENGPERYSFTWAGKRDAIRLLQAPSAATLVPAKEESINFDTTENIFIEGENLEVLKLLQKSYFGRIKMIYIDPPYNTGNDFIYPDNFADPLDYYLRLTGQKDSEGNLLTSNPESNGRFHSAWLSMMYPRLHLARSLLTEDGVICISIDDHELMNLRRICDEVFGEERFIAAFVWKSRQNRDNRNVSGVSIDHEYVLCYGKSVRGAERDISQYSNPDNDSRGDWASANMVGLATADRRPNLHYDLINPETGINYGCPEMGWRYDQKTMPRLISEKSILWPNSPDGRPRRKSFLNELSSPFTGFSSLIGANCFTRNGTAEIDEIFGFRAMDFPKPVQLIKEIIGQGLSSEDIILDFFSGSCTTAHAVFELNKEHNGKRKFIMVQLPEPCREDSQAAKAGFKTIAEIGKERIRRVIKNYKVGQQNLFSNGDLGVRVYKLAESNFLSWSGIKESDPAEYLTQLDLFSDPLKKQWTDERIITEVAIKEGFGLNFRMESIKNIQSNSVFKVSDFDKDQSFFICLDQSIDMNGLKPLNLSEKDTLFVRDLALTDEIAANLALQCRLKTI